MNRILKNKRVSVIGENHPEGDNYELAYQLGRYLGSSGCMVFCGGLGGVMEAVSKGVQEEGGTTIGIVPSLDKKDANLHIVIPIVTGMGYARNIIVANNGEVVIAIGGHYGTLSEIAYALNSGIPVIAMNSWDLKKEGLNLDLYHRVKTLGELKHKLLELCRKTH
ncbi:MAG: TIGR00725 family protein [Nitrospinae bacterium]|nr:TIGR00725 family protein [Nitrospinota bacterium]